MKTLITQKLTAELMDKSVRTIHRYIKDGRLKANAQGKVYVSSLPTEIQDKLFAMPSHPTHKTSDIHMYKVKIKFASSTDELHEVVNEIINHFGTFPHALLPAYKERLGGHIGPVSASLYRVIADTDSRELYNQYKGYITIFDEMDLLSTGYYHEALEEKLCKEIYQSVKDGTFLSATTPTWMMQKLEALAVAGRSLTQDTLEAIDQEINSVRWQNMPQKEMLDEQYIGVLRNRITGWKQVCSRRLR